MPALYAHSLRVNFLRRFFPVLAVCLLIVVTVWPLANEWRTNLKSKNSQTRLKVEAIAMSLPQEGKPMQLHVSKPEYTGRDDKGRAYVVTAEKVTQDGLRPGTSIMDLESPTARMQLNDTTQETIGVKAHTGRYDPDTKSLQLDGDVVITHSTGYKLNATALQVNLAEGSSISDDPVTGEGPNGRLSGEKLELLDKGNHIILHGKSKVVLTPDNES